MTSDDYKELIELRKEKENRDTLHLILGGIFLIALFISGIRVVSAIYFNL